MTYYHAGLLLSFFIIAYMITVDRNVAYFLILNLKLLRINLERLKFMIIYHPKNPITNFVMRLRYAKLTKELMKANSQTVHSD
jgi:hypothetical protein